MTFRFISNYGTWLLAHDFQSLPCSLSRLGSGASSRPHDVCRSSLSKKRSGAVSSALRQVQKIRSFGHKGCLHVN